MGVFGPDSRAWLVLGCAVAMSAVLAASLDRPSGPARPTASGRAPVILPENARIQEGAQVTVEAQGAARLWLTLGNDPMEARPGQDRISFPAHPQRAQVARMLATPTAMQWRHPRPGLPSALVVRAAQSDEAGARGPFTMQTYLFAGHGELPVVSISCPPQDLIGEEQGLLVPGNGILRLPQGQLDSYALDPRWWKYPGNYHGRGDAWERSGRLQVIDPSGTERFQADIRLRINGQMTRGFPQHALRLLFNEPLRAGVFGAGDAGREALVLRAAGNDQVKAMLRDAFQHRLCEGLPFTTSAVLTCVAYINGAYQGVHHLRERIDELELARLHGVPPRRITILEDRSELYRGDSADIRRFNRLMGRTERWDGLDPAWLDTLEAQLDVSGFLTYMASQMILGNMDWPKQNVKYWRYTGPPRPEAPLDGRWRFIMGDSDLGFGANAGPDADLFATVRDAGVPVSRLFLAMMRSPELRKRFVDAGLGLLDGPLSPERCMAVLDGMAAQMAPEMDRHTARWRKPADRAQWEREVQLMRDYAQRRAVHARRQLNAYIERR
jgi:hypothetical protein